MIHSALVGTLVAYKMSFAKLKQVVPIKRRPVRIGGECGCSCKFRISIEVFGSIGKYHGQLIQRGKRAYRRVDILPKLIRFPGFGGNQRRQREARATATGRHRVNRRKDLGVAHCQIERAVTASGMSSNAPTCRSW